MRTFRSRLWTGALPAMLAFAGLGMLAMAEGRAGFTAHEKAFYADPSVVLYVQPGLNINVVSAKIAANGTISVDYKLTDPTGAPLDQTGVTTPGPVTLSFLAAYIPSGQAQYTSYITRVATAAIGWRDGHAGHRGFRRNDADGLDGRVHLYLQDRGAVRIQCQCAPTGSAFTAPAI